MKKLILAVAMLAVTFSASAQLTFGVKAGANLSSISDIAEGKILDFGDLAKSATNQSMKVGFNVGVFAEYKLTNLIGVQIEALYSLQGVNTKNESTSTLLGTSSVTTNDITSSYVNIPVLAKIHFGGLAVYAGPQFGFAGGLKSAWKQVAGNTTTTKDNTYKAGDYNAFDLSGVIGASYMVTSNIGVDARYNLGLTNVFPAEKNSEGEVITKAYGKNSSIQIGVFYAF